MSSAFGFFWIDQHKERPLYHVHVDTSRYLSESQSVIRKATVQRGVYINI